MFKTIKTGDQAYCINADWVDMADSVAVQPNIIATLDFPDTL
jgi:hypothetical protein